MGIKLGKDVFVALAAIAWADGEVSEPEATALLAGARASRLGSADLDAVRAALRERTDLSRVRSLTLSHEEREFVHAIAAWLTRVDGVVSEEEVVALAKLGALLGLSESEQERAVAASAALDAAPGGRDVMALAKEIERGADEA